MRIETDAKGVIQTVTLFRQDWPGDCGRKTEGSVPGSPWKTGRGLALRDSKQRVIELYGEPNSMSPSVGHGQELELLFYAFDWAGSDVPQVMEVTCDRASGQVIEITLAFPSL